MGKPKIQVLIAEDEEIIREMVAIIISENYDLDVLEAENGNEAIEILKSCKVDLIISDLNMPQKNGDHIYLYNKNNNKAAFVFITSIDISKNENLNDFFEQKNHYYLPKPFTEEEVFSTFDKIFKNNEVFKEKPLLDEDNKTKYSSIPIYLAHHLTKDIGEIFIKINERKYLKYLDKIEHGDSEKFKKLQQKNCKEIFVLNGQYEKWIQSRFEQINNSLKKTPENIHSREMALDTILKLSQVAFNVGPFPPSLINEFEFFVDTVITSLWDTEEVKDSVQSLLKEGGIIPIHSSVCLFLSKLVNAKLNKNDKAKYKKLALASLFHDITLPDEEFAQYITLEKLSAGPLTSEEKDLILHHPYEAAKKVESIPLFDLDTIDMIKHHHELPHAKGYPLQADLKKLKFLCRQFTMIHYLSYIIAKTGKLTKADYFETRDIFDDDEFLQILDIIYDYFNPAKDH